MSECGDESSQVHDQLFKARPGKPRDILSSAPHGIIHQRPSSNFSLRCMPSPLHPYPNKAGWNIIANPDCGAGIARTRGAYINQKYDYRFSPTSLPPEIPAQGKKDQDQDTSVAEEKRQWLVLETPAHHRQEDPAGRMTTDASGTAATTGAATEARGRAPQTM